MTDQSPAVVFLMGPTAAGKTGLALELAERFPAEIISVDSAQVYRGMDIGTAKASAQDQARVPHHLIDIRAPDDPYSAAAFRQDALRAIKAIHGRDRLPILAGGTMLYFRALSEGLSPLPGADPEVREAIENEAAELGWAAMHAQLKGLDPEAGAEIHPNDPQRIQRALEVIRLSGQPLSRLQDDDLKEELPFSILPLILAPASRKVLHQRIEMRFRAMLDSGLIEEVERLRNQDGMHLDLPSMRAVGYRQVWQYLDGDYDRRQLLHRGTAATRQLAKRQLTWLRRESHAVWYDSQTAEVPESAADLVAQVLENQRG